MTGAAIRGALTSLSAYVEGNLNYVWIDFPISDEDYKKALVKIGNPEETFYTDFENNFCGLKLSEYTGKDTLNEIAEFINELDSHEENTFSAILKIKSKFKDAKEIFENERYNFFEDCHSETDLGRIVAENMDIPERLEIYIDYEAIGRDHDANTSGGFTSYGYIEIY